MTCIFCIVLKNNHNTKTTVLRKKIDEPQVLEIVDDKKTASFKSMFSRPKRTIYTFIPLNSTMNAF